MLKGFGWRFHRIWSKDCFHLRVAEIDQLRTASDAAVDRAVKMGRAVLDGEFAMTAEQRDAALPDEETS